MFIRNVVLFLMILLFDCMIGPNYRRPEIEVPQNWRFTDEEAKKVTNTVWWEQLGDTVFNNLLNQALEQNKDIKIASYRIEEFKGRLTTTRSNLFPQFSVNAIAGVSNSFQTGTQAAVPVGANRSSMFYETVLNASWQLDLWGKLRRADEAAKAELIGNQYIRRGVILSLIINFANGYINLRSLDEQYSITQNVVKDLEYNYHLFLLQFDQGFISNVELNQAKSEYEQALSVLPSISLQIAQQEDLLSTLSGLNPTSIRRGKKITELNLPAVPADLPSSLLLNRPDILEAEQNLIAANAQIGIARAQYFPSISLTGLIGIASTGFVKLFTDPSTVWNASAPILAPIFNAGAIKGQVRSAEALQMQSLIRYQQSIQTAFREVEDALVDQQKTRERIVAIEKQVDALENTANYARLRFNTGLIGYIDVLTAEVSFFQTSLVLIQTKAHLFQALGNLYSTMGGGWIVNAEAIVSDSLGRKKGR